MKKRSSMVTTVTEVEAEHFDIPSEIHKGLVAYRATGRAFTNTVRNGRRYNGEPVEHVFAGICNKWALDDFLSGKSLTIPEYATVRRGEWSSAIIAVKPEYLRQARTKGWPYASVMGDEDPFHPLRVSDPIAATAAGEEFIFVEAYGAGHQLFDIDGFPLPNALRFNYIDGRFDNGVYDLEKAARILLGREDVVLTESGGQRYSAFGYGEEFAKDDPKRYIGSIPGYNANPGRDQCLAFLWQPSAEDYRRVFEAALKDGGRAPSSSDLRVACFSIDVFGLRAGGAAYFNDYYKDKRAS